MMDGKRVKVESKCDTRCNDGVDRISQLPDEIIVDILSNLRLRDAASTSVLSTRWHDLWRYTPVLDATEYSEYIGNEKKFFKWMDSIVENHKAHSLKKFSLPFDLDRSSLSAVTKWLEFAFSKRVEVMRLGAFSYATKWNPVSLDELLKFRPRLLLKSSTLTSLHLTSLRASGDAIKLILRHCHLLERLMIKYVVFTSDVDISGKLKHLEISSSGWPIVIKIAAPDLTYLGIKGREEMISVEKAPKLVEMDFITREHSNLLKHCVISQLQILTIRIMDPILNFLAKRNPTMPKLVELNVSYFGPSKHLLPTLTSLLRASPLLQTINLQVNKYYENDMNEVVIVEAFEHRNLRVFKFCRFESDAAHHMELVSFIFDNCVALRKLIVEPSKSCHYLSAEKQRAIREAAMEKAKLLIQPNLPTHIQLQVIT